MQFVFKGVPGESHESINMYGTVFPLGEPTNIEGDKFVAKLANHPHFCAVHEPVATEETQTHESTGEPPTLDELKAEAIALGIAVKGTWGVKKLGEEIAKLKAA